MICAPQLSAFSRAITSLINEVSNLLMVCWRVQLYLLLWMLQWNWRLLKRGILEAFGFSSSINYCVSFTMIQENIRFEKNLDYFSAGLYRLSLRDVNQSDSSLSFICLFMLFSTRSTFQIEPSIAYCSAIISCSRLVRKIAAFQISYMTFYFSSEVAIIFCSTSSQLRTNQLGEACTSQLAEGLCRSSSLGQQQFSTMRQMLRLRLFTNSSLLQRFSLIKSRSFFCASLSPSGPITFMCFQELSIYTTIRKVFSRLSVKVKESLANVNVSPEEELQRIMMPTYSLMSGLL